MIKEIQLRRFKRFENETIKLRSRGLTICAGPNSSGKSTLLQALAVWSFGILVVRQFKGDEAVRSGYTGQGAGISDDDFTPINIPDLRHLWLNLKSQVPNEGYSMAITAKWDELVGEDTTQERELCMSFSLVQDRLYVKAVNSNLAPSTHIPTVVYVPPVAGVDAREEFATSPKRRAMLGRGLAGAVLRNYLYDLAEKSQVAKQVLQDTKGKKLSATETKRFKAKDPWERLNIFSREIFGFELKVDKFNPDFHTVLRVLIQPKVKVNERWKNSGVARDLMVEGSGAQQWLTVLTFALSPDTNVLLLDEPDAHLFTGLKLELIQLLSDISEQSTGPQILVATHATEILKRHPVERILSFGRRSPKYLKNDIQRTKLISGLGDDYAPLIENARASKLLLFVENLSDERILKSIAQTLKLGWPKNLAVLPTTDHHSDRLKLYKNLLEPIEGLRAISVRDRDNKPFNTVDQITLFEKGINITGFPDFLPFTLRRREIENYALVATALSRLVSPEKVESWWGDQGWAWPQDMKIDSPYYECDIKKELGVLLKPNSVEDLFSKMKKKEINPDLERIVKEICK